MYIIIETKNRDKITDVYLMECVEKYGIFLTRGEALAKSEALGIDKPFDYFMLVRIDV